MQLPVSRVRFGLVLFLVGAISALVGLLLWSGTGSAVALVLAVMLLAAGTLLFGTSRSPPGRATP